MPSSPPPFLTSCLPACPGNCASTGHSGALSPSHRHPSVKSCTARYVPYRYVPECHDQAISRRPQQLLLQRRCRPDNVVYPEKECAWAFDQSQAGISNKRWTTLLGTRLLYSSSYRALAEDLPLSVHPFRDTISARAVPPHSFLSTQ